MAKRDGIFVDAGAGAPSYSGIELRQMLAPLQPGVFGSGDFKVTIGSGLAIGADLGIAVIQGNSVAAQGRYLVSDDAAENSATWERFGGGTGIPANASANPRLDACVLKQYDGSVDGSGRRDWVRMYVPGVAAGGAALGGALPALPANSLLIAEVLVPGNNPTSIPAANIRDRRPWARGAQKRLLKANGDVTLGAGAAGWNDIDTINLQSRIECSGAPLELAFSFTGSFTAGVSTAGRIAGRWNMDGATAEGTNDGVIALTPFVQFGRNVAVRHTVVPAAGSHVFKVQANNWEPVAGGIVVSGSVNSPVTASIREVLGANSDNT